MTHNIQITNCVHHWADRGNFRLFISCEFCVKHTEQNHYNVPTWKQTQRLEITFFLQIKIDSPLNINFKQREISITTIDSFANKVYPSSTLSVCLWCVISRTLFYLSTIRHMKKLIIKYFYRNYAGIFQFKSFNETQFHKLNIAFNIYVLLCWKMIMIQQKKTIKLTNRTL